MPLVAPKTIVILPNIELIGDVAINIKEILHIAPLDQGGCEILYKRKVQPVVFSGKAGDSVIKAIQNSRKAILPTQLIKSTEYQLIEESLIPANKQDKDATFMATTAIKEYLEAKYETKLNLRTVGVNLKAMGFVRKAKKVDGFSTWGYLVNLVDVAIDNNYIKE